MRKGDTYHDTKFCLRNQDFGFSYELLVGGRRGAVGTDFRHVAGQPIEFKEIGDNEHFPPVAVFSREEVQDLFEELWRAGFRPRRHEDSTSALESVRYHLEDMRRIALAKTPMLDEHLDRKGK